MNPLLQDARYALRSFAKRPGFTLAAVLSIGVGIAATTVVFSLLNTALFKQVPGITRPERLVEISRAVGSVTTDVTWPVYDRLRSEQALLEELAAFALVAASLDDGGEPVARAGLAVTASYFTLLGVQPILGRTFAADEASFPRVEPVVLISHEAWQRELQGARDAIGRSVRVNGVPLEVIGVLPEGFAGHHAGLLVDVFVPFGLQAPGLPRDAVLEGSSTLAAELLGRLRAGVSRGDAAQGLGAVADRFARETGELRGQHPYRVAVEAWGPLPGLIRGPVSIFLSVMLVLVGLALAMACVNVTTILLARSIDRQRELAVRRAMGATRGRLVLQIVSEVTVLFLIAGVVGVVLGGVATGLLGRLAPALPIPGRLGGDFGLDFRVMGFAALVTFGAALAFSLVPALAASRFDLVPTLREGATTDPRSRARLRAALVGIQVAVTSVLLMASALFGRALQNMKELRPQWNLDGVLVTALDLELNGTAQEAGLVFHRELLRRVRAMPEVDAAAFAAKLPGGGRSSFGLVRPAGADPAAPGLDASLNRVSGAYFRSLGLPLLRGRDFGEADGETGPRVAIVNQTMAERVWPGADPVGARFVAGSGAFTYEFEVVGVAADARPAAPGQPAEVQYFIPLAQWYNAAAHLHVRARNPAAAGALGGTLRRALREAAPSLPLAQPRPMTEALEIFLLPQRVAALVAALMGGFCLVLATIGIYGVTTFAVSRRGREMAIRMALGASAGQVTRLVMRQGSRAPAIGLVVGLGVALAVAGPVSGVVAGVDPGDPVPLSIVPILVTLVTVGAMYQPVRRLVRGSPMRRLRL